MIERVPECGYQRFHRAGVYQIIEDYFKFAESHSAVSRTEFERSERLLFGSRRWTEYFDELCDGCGLEPSFVRRRIIEFINNPVKDDYHWMNCHSLAQRILGLCDYNESVTYFRRRGRKLKNLKLRLVK